MQRDLQPGERIVSSSPEPDWAKPRALTQGSRDALFYLHRRFSEAAGGAISRSCCASPGTCITIAATCRSRRRPTSHRAWCPTLTAGGGAFLHLTHDGAEHGTILRPPALADPRASSSAARLVLPHPAVSRARTVVTGCSACATGDCGRR